MYHRQRHTKTSYSKPNRIEKFFRTTQHYIALLSSSVPEKKSFFLPPQHNNVLFSALYPSFHSSIRRIYLPTCARIHTFTCLHAKREQQRNVITKNARERGTRGHCALSPGAPWIGGRLYVAAHARVSGRSEKFARAEVFFFFCFQASS